MEAVGGHPEHPASQALILGAASAQLQPAAAMLESGLTGLI